LNTNLEGSALKRLIRRIVRVRPVRRHRLWSV